MDPNLLGVLIVVAFTGTLAGSWYLTMLLLHRCCDCGRIAGVGRAYCKRHRS